MADIGRVRIRIPSSIKPGEVVRARDVGLDPLSREARARRALAGQLEQRLARVHRHVGHANPVASQSVHQQEVLVPLPGAQAQDLYGTGGYVPSEVVRGPSDEGARPLVVPVGAVRAEGQPGPDG